MKKFFTLIIIAGVFASCNSGQDTTSGGNTAPPVSTVDSPAVVNPSVNDSIGIMMDTAGRTITDTFTTGEKR